MFTVCGIIHPRCCRPPAGNIVGELYHKLETLSIAPEDGRNHRPKHIELIGIINKPLLLHLVGCLYYLYTFACCSTNALNLVSHIDGGREAVFEKTVLRQVFGNKGGVKTEMEGTAH